MDNSYTLRGVMPDLVWPSGKSLQSLMLSILLFSCTSSMSAQDIVWNGGGDGVNWEDPFNWDTNTLPQPNQQVLINTSSDIVLSTTVGIVDLHLGTNSGSLTIAASGFLMTDSGPDGYGIYLQGGGFMLVNEGTMRLEDASGAGVLIDGSASILNQGTLEINRPINNGLLIESDLNEVVTIQNTGQIQIAMTGQSGIGVFAEENAQVVFINEGILLTNQTDGGFYATTVNNALVQFSNLSGAEWLFQDYEMSSNQRALLTIGAVDIVNDFCGYIEMDNNGSAGLDLRNGSTFENNGLLFTTQYIHFPLTTGSVFNNQNGRVVLLGSPNASFNFPVTTPNPNGAPNDTDGVIDGVAASLEEAGGIAIVADGQAFGDPVERCEGDPDITLSVDGASPNGQYAWNTGSTTSTTIVSSIPINSGKYTVTVSETDCPDFEAFVQVSVLSAPPATGSGSVAIAFCEDALPADRLVSIDPTDPAIDRVEWMLTSSPAPGSMTSFFTLSGLKNEIATTNNGVPVGDYSLSALTIGTNGCTSTQTVDFSITVDALPMGTLSTAVSGFCMDQDFLEFTFTAVTGTGPFDLNLNSDDGDGQFTDMFVVNNVQSGVTFTISTSLLDGGGAVGPLTIRLEDIADNSNGCISSNIMQELSISIQPTVIDAAFSPFDPQLCEGESVQFGVSVIDLGNGLQNPPPGYTYSWSLQNPNLGTLSNANSVSPTFTTGSLTANATATATVMIGDPMGACTASFDYSIDLFAIPVLSAATQTICSSQGMSVDLTTLTGIVSSVSADFAFYENDPNSGGTPIDNLLTPANEEENYNLTDFIQNGGTLFLQASNGPCVEAIPIPVLFDDPSGTISAVDASACVDDDRFFFNFSGSGGTPPYQLTISENSAGPQTLIITNLSSLDQFELLFTDLGSNAPGSFSVQLISITDAAGCTVSATATAPIQVSINTNPQVNLASGATTCEGDNIMLQASVAGGSSYTYSWSPSGAFVDPTIEDAVFLGAVIPGTYPVTLTVTDQATGCQDAQMMSVEVVPTPNYQAVASSAVICKGDPLMISFIEMGGHNQTATLTLTLNDGTPTNQTFSNVGANYQVTLIEGLDFTGDLSIENIQLTYGSNGVTCSSTLSNISLDVIDDLDIASSFTAPASNGSLLCSGEQTDIDFSSTYTGAVGVDYDFVLLSIQFDIGNDGTPDGIGYGPVLGNLISGQTINSGIAEVLENTLTSEVRLIYRVAARLQGTPACQSTIETVEVVVGQDIDPSVAMPALVCIDDDPFNLLGSPAGGTFSGTGITDANAGTFDPDMSGTGSFVVSYAGTVAGCPYMATATVDVGPVIQVDGVGPLCENDASITLKANPMGGFFAGPGIIDGNAGTFDPSMAGAGMQLISYTTTDPMSCTGTVTTTILVHPAPMPMISGIPSVCEDDAPIQLSASPVGGVFSGIGVNASGVLNPAAVNGGSTTVTYTVTNAFNCTASAQMLIAINPLPVVSIAAVGPFCLDDPAIQLSGSPSGGTYSGDGITDPVLGTFDPAIAGEGTAVITYEASTAQGCTNQATQSILVEDCTVVTPTITNDHPLITDPCTCIGNNRFAEAVLVMSNPGETWQVVTTTLIDPNTDQPYPTGTLLLPLVGNPDLYVLNGEHESAIGFSIEVQRSSDPLPQPLSIANLCYYSEVAIQGLESHYCLNEPAVPVLFDAGGAAGTASFFLNNAPFSPPIFDPGTLPAGLYTIRLEFDAGTAGSFDPSDPGCVATVEEEVYVSTSAGALGCDDTVNVTLNTDCFAVITPDIIQEGGDPQDNVFVQIKDENGVMLPSDTVTGAYVGQYLEVSVIDACGNNNSCWGYVFIEDKFIPKLLCQNYEIQCFEPDSPGVVVHFPVPGDVTVTETGVNTYTLDGFDSCGPTTLTYADALQQPMCVGPYSDIIIRSWQATDVNGNQTSCVDTIFLLRGSLADVIPPPNYNNIDQPALNCGDSFLRLANGAPDTTVTGSPGGAYVCSTIKAVFTDLEFPACGGSQEFLRRWVVTDWCTNEIREINQIIKIQDMTAPTITCPADITAGTGTDDCLADVSLPDPTIVDDCSSTTYTVSASAGTIIDYGNQNFVLADLPLGIHTVTYTVMDACGNTSSCSFAVEAIDNAVPTVICDNPTVISLLPNGLGFINAPTFDDGSFDNCGNVFFKARRMDVGGCDDLNADDDLTLPGAQEYFDDQVGFCCGDVATGSGFVMVVFRVYDVDPGPGPVKPDREEAGGDLFGRYNDCMVEVQVQDKAPPFLSCPPNVTVSCDFWFDQNNLGSVFGEVVTSTAAQQDIIIDDPGNPNYTGPEVVGTDGLATDLCGVTIEETPIFAALTCGEGILRRVFTATDAGGNISSCIQEISIQNFDPFVLDDITFPPDITIDGCAGSPDTEPSNTGEPTWDAGNCSMVAASKSDLTFPSANNCFLILRTWTVLNDCPGAAGPFTDVQRIEVRDMDAPVITSNCEDIFYCAYGDFCTGQIDLVAAANDCTPAEDLVWEYKIDLNNDDPGNVYDIQGNTNDASGTYPVGTHEILWLVKDPCDNMETCSYLFTVEDCLEPTALCPTGISTQVIGPTGEVTLEASSLDFGSKDNCTADADLVFSFSTDTMDQTITFNCDSLSMPTRTVTLYVTDEAGNQSSCPVVVLVTDANPSACSNVPLSTALVTGYVMDEAGNEVHQVEVMLNDTLMHYTADSNIYVFADLNTQNPYEIVPNKNIDHDNGVSTFDIVLVRRHILLLDTLDSPYKLIAADANNSGTISTFDIVHMTKVILKEWDEFPNNTSWRFVDMAYQFPDPENPWQEVFPESYLIPNLQTDMFDLDFVAVKVGDVNGTANPEQLQGSQSRDAVGQLLLEIPDLTFERGDQLRLPLRAAAFKEVFGLQFGLHFDENILRYRGMGYQHLDEDHLQVGLAETTEGKLRFSWSSAQPVSLDPEDIWFVLEFEAQADGRLSEGLSLQPDLMAPEAYLSADLDLYDLHMLYTDPDVPMTDQAFQLMPNRPNPFQDETVISFLLPQADGVELSIFDAQGRLIQQRKGTFEAGYQEWSVSRSDLGSAGVYYYQIETSRHQAMGKMIVQE